MNRFPPSTPTTTRSPRSRVAFRAVPVLALTAWSLLGCYRYVPISEAAPADIAGRVRVALAAKGTLAVVGALGANVRAVDGTVVRTTSDSLYLRAEQTTSLTGVRIEMFGAPLTIARSDALSVEARRPDKKRSIIAVATLVVGLLVFTTVISLGASGSLDGEPSPPPVTRIPR